MPDLIPFARYDDPTRAIGWLCAAFGMNEHLVVPGPDGSVVHAELRLGRGIFMLGESKKDPLGMRTPGQAGGSTQGTYGIVEDIDDHYARAEAAGAELVMELRDTEYGSREYSVRDLEGHLWTFGTYRPEPAPS